MVTQAFALTVCIGFFLPIDAFSDPAATNLPLRAALTLSDGSRVLGIPRIASIPFQTAYARIDLPLKQVQSIKVESDHENVALALTNGDKLKGTLQLKPIELETLFGIVKIDFTLIADISVYPGGKGSLPATLQEGLVLYYSFDQDDGNKVTDASGKGHDGAVTGATWTPEGKVGGAYSFDGRDHIDTGFPFGAGVDELSASLWMMDTKGTGNGVVAGIDFTATPEGKDYVWSIYYDRTRFLWARARHPDESWTTTYGNIFPTNQWQHLVITFKRNDYLRFYQNGVLVGQQATKNAGTIAGTTCTAGLPGTSGSSYDGCKLDEVRFYNRALSKDEAQMLYDGQK